MARKWGVKVSQQVTMCVVLVRESAEWPSAGIWRPGTAAYSRLGDCFIHQQNRNVVPHRIDAMAHAALQALAVLFDR